MSLKSLLTTALLLGSTSAALARPIVSTAGAGVRVDAQWGAAGSVVRDHRVATAPILPAPVGGDRYVISNGFPKGTVHDVHGWYTHALPADTRDRSTIECRNWDPLVDFANERCAPSNMSPLSAPKELPGWTTLGARDSSVPDAQFITVEQTFHRLHIRTIQGMPSMTKLQVRYMDGSADLIEVDSRMMKRGFMLPLKNQPIDQLIFYTASNSKGVYLVSAS